MKPLLTLLAAVALLAGKQVAAGEIEDACTDLVLDYAIHRDRLDADSYANLFAADAVLSVLDDRFVGRDAIHERLVESRGKETTRHLMSTHWFLISLSMRKTWCNRHFNSRRNGARRNTSHEQ